MLKLELHRSPNEADGLNDTVKEKVRPLKKSNGAVAIKGSLAIEATSGSYCREDAHRTEMGFEEGKDS
ncbi:hypothetical protein, partial [Klebsiella aerogenes]|uniref:hypothetical protein n=1 Tax=Klebsiella aerogenes TaxID=548 RepID=UPI001CC5C365